LEKWMNESEWAVMVSKADKLASLVYKLLKTHHCNNDCSLLKKYIKDDVPQNR